MDAPFRRLVVAAIMLGTAALPTGCKKPEVVVNWDYDASFDCHLGPAGVCEDHERKCGGATCGNACVDTTLDTQNCGACGLVCTALKARLTISNRHIHAKDGPPSRGLCQRCPLDWTHSRMRPWADRGFKARRPFSA